MATIRRFEELDIWKLARALSSEVWTTSTQGTFANDYGLKNQINRSSGSTMDNIAEGFGRGGNKEFSNFSSIARASNDEVRSQLYRAFDRKHIVETEFEQLKSKTEKLGVKISNMISYLKNAEHKGQKFK